MASKRQIEANRRNARRSTGPKSYEGRLAASRNAWRHGLSMPIEMTPEMARKLAELCGLLSVDHQQTHRPEMLKRVVESHLAVKRVREARHAAILALIASKERDSCSTLQSFHRYERAALSRRGKGLAAYLGAAPGS